MAKLCDDRHLKTQRDVIRDVMLSAADCATWLTLAELHKLTGYGEASISAQIRHLRNGVNYGSSGTFSIKKRRRPRTDLPPGWRQEPGPWEYRIIKALDGNARRVI